MRILGPHDVEHLPRIECSRLCNLKPSPPRAPRHDRDTREYQAHPLFQRWGKYLARALAWACASVPPPGWVTAFRVGSRRLNPLGLEGCRRDGRAESALHSAGRLIRSAIVKVGSDSDTTSCFGEPAERNRQVL
jgi:hypothetical protein